MYCITDVQDNKKQNVNIMVRKNLVLKNFEECNPVETTLIIQRIHQ